MRKIHMRIICTILAMLCLFIQSGCSNETEEEITTTTIPLIETDMTSTDTMNPDFDPTKLATPNRCQVYGTTTTNFGSMAFPQYETSYKDLGTLSYLVNLFHDTPEALIDIYWYGYADSEPLESITLDFVPPVRKASTYTFTVTSHYNGQDTIIYQSCKAEQIYSWRSGYQIALAPSFRLQTFYRNELDAAVANGDIPKSIAYYDLPADADYFCKASLKLRFSEESGDS